MAEGDHLEEQVAVRLAEGHIAQLID
jgi:hypothetical protein